MARPGRCLQSFPLVLRWGAEMLNSDQNMAQFLPQSRRFNLWCVVRVKLSDRPPLSLSTSSQCGGGRRKADGGSKPCGSRCGCRNIEQLRISLLLGLKLSSSSGKTEGDKKEEVKKSWLHLEQRNWRQPSPFPFIRSQPWSAEIGGSMFSLWLTQFPMMTVTFNFPTGQILGNSARHGTLSAQNYFTALEHQRTKLYSVLQG